MEVIVHKESFKIKEVQGEVHFDRPFRIQIKLSLPERVDAHSWINQPARFQHYTGIITAITTGGIQADGRLTELLIEPTWVALQDKQGPKLWPPGTAFECVSLVLQEHGYHAHQICYIGKQTSNRPYWLQVAGETDLNFVSRVLRQANLHYRFDTDANDQEQVILSDAYINNQLGMPLHIDQHVRATMTDRHVQVHWQATEDRYTLGQAVQWTRLSELTEGDQIGVVTGLRFQATQPVMYGGDSKVLSIELKGELENGAVSASSDSAPPYFFLANLKQSYVYPDFIRNEASGGFPLRDFHALGRFPYYDGGKLVIGQVAEGALAILGTLPDKQHAPVTNGEHAAWIDKYGQGIESNKEALKLFTVDRSSVLTMLAQQTKLSTQGRLVCHGHQALAVRALHIEQEAAEQIVWRVHHQASFKLDQSFSLYAQQVMNIRVTSTFQLEAKQKVRFSSDSLQLKSDKGVLIEAAQLVLSGSTLSLSANEHLELKGNSLILNGGSSKLCLHPNGTVDFIGSSVQFGRGPVGGSYSPTYYA